MSKAVMPEGLNLQNLTRDASSLEKSPRTWCVVTWPWLQKPLSRAIGFGTASAIDIGTGTNTGAVVDAPL